MSGAAIAKCWTFASSSGGGRYQTLLYADGSTSCDCPGWCRRVAGDGSRSCKHTRSVLMGTADQECESKHDSHAAPAPIRSQCPAGGPSRRSATLANGKAKPELAHFAFAPAVSYGSSPRWGLLGGGSGNSEALDVGDYVRVKFVRTEFATTARGQPFKSALTIPSTPIGLL